MRVSAYTLIKDEAPWVGFCIMAARDHVSEFVYFDGNSTDGTLELLEYIKKTYGVNIRVFRGMDPKDLRDDYVRMFNECIKWCDGDYVWFLHPDMVLATPPTLEVLRIGPLAYSVGMESFGGDPGHWPLKITSGRTDKWKSIMRNGFGLHYDGWYGTADEDMYFSDITGKQHHLYGDFDLYPYEVVPSGITLFHYSDVRPYTRRIERMVKCLMNENPKMERQAAYDVAKAHPRVCLEPAKFRYINFDFEPAPLIPDVFKRYGEEFASVLGRKVDDFLPIALSRGGVHA